MSNEQPWWMSSHQASFSQEPKKSPRNLSVGIALAIALFAGATGAGLDRLLNVHSANVVSTQSAIERAPGSIAAIAAKVSPSVVNIDASSAQAADTGSGFFIDSNGYILTNNHVIESAATSGGQIKVTLSSGESYPANVIGRAPEYDIAVLKIDVSSAPALTFGNSEKVVVGDSVIAIGSPLGLAGTVTSGIISAKDRAVSTGSSTQSSFINAIQTDAAINPGNSGGPLVDMTGAVIGINSAIASLDTTSTFASSQSGSIGLGFAIPINQAKKVADQLIKTGKATYPVVGVKIDTTYQGEGARVAPIAGGVLAGSPAAKVGIKPGDIITEFAGKKITNSDELVVAIRSHSVGERVSITVLRGGSKKVFSLTLVASKQ
jgi:putative serine protease PepD